MRSIWTIEEFEARLGLAGIHGGYFMVPASRNESAWGAQMVRCVVFSSGVPGPKLLVSSGVHGDEIEGPVGLSQILADPGQLMPTCGSVAFLPVANPDAFRGAARHSPADSANLNRLFGKAGATTSSEAVKSLLCELLSMSDALVDLHSGGRSLEFVPCAMWHEHSSLVGWHGSRALALGTGLSVGVAIRSNEPDGTFDNLAALQGKISVAVELGGGGYLHSENYGAVKSIIRQAMASLGGPAAQNSVSATVVEWPSLLYAFEDGLVEHCCPLGCDVSPGDLVARLHSQVGSENYQVREYLSPCDGVVLARRSIPTATPGDVLVAISQKSRDMGE